ncbi:MAG: ATP-binding cassette domain-containing protein [Sphaerochaetaceae bacterium]|nr:ATP-binding cassette domain-containing protein [Sphaerochaetaceae bacterium]
MKNDIILEVKDVKKHFDISKTFSLRKDRRLVKAVDGVGFSLQSGRTLAVVGESGCGKTTLARLLLLLEEPTEGTILFKGKDINNFSKSDLNTYRTCVQAVLQDPWGSLNPRMRVKDLVSESIEINTNLSRQEIQKKVEQTLLDVGLSPEHKNYYPHEFSGGQRQRIAIAGALISDPSLIILDEPVSALDVSIRSQIMNLFKDLQVKYGLTYLLIAHDLGTTRYMADEIAVMYLGKIVEHGNSEQVFKNTMHPYTKALFSAALPARISDKPNEIILKGEIPSPISPPSGCAFHTRCPVKIGKRCEQVVPLLQKVDEDDPSHLVACHLYTRKEL